jgi:cell division topological specificity factor
MSENIFKEIYTKVLSLFKQTEKVDENAKDVAKNRLRVVLMQDRTNLTPELLQRMRKELIELLSKYVEMDKEALELNFDQEGDQMALMLSIPVIRAKDEEEIEKALAEKDSEKEKDSDEEAEDSEEESDLPVLYARVSFVDDVVFHVSFG